MSDVLLLTRPIGSGIAKIAVAQKLASKKLAKELKALTGESNEAEASEFVKRGLKTVELGALGLLGAAAELAVAAKKLVVIELERVPLLAGVPELSEQGVATHEGVPEVNGVMLPEGLPEPIAQVLFDADASGALLVAVPEGEAQKLGAALHKKGVESWLIGALVKGKAGVTLA